MIGTLTKGLDQKGIWNGMLKEADSNVGVKDGVGLFQEDRVSR